MYEEEHNNKISFLDVLIFRNNSKIQTTVHQKSTHNDVYLQWDSFAPDTWKRSTFEYYLLIAQKACSEETLLQKEIEDLKRVLENTNGYLKWATTQVIELVQNNVLDNSTCITSNESMTTNNHTLILLDHKFQIACNGTKLGSKFNVKNLTKREHKHDLLQSVICPEKHCVYSGKTGRRISECIEVLGGKDKNFHVYQQSILLNHPLVPMDCLPILSGGIAKISSNEKCWRLYSLR